MDQDEFVTIKVLTSRQAADLEATRLEAAGIPTNVEVDDCGGMLQGMMTASGARLQVPAGRVAEARELLGQPPLPKEAVPAQVAPPAPRSGGTKARLAVTAVIAFLAGVGATRLWHHLSLLGEHTYELDSNLDGKPDRWDVSRGGFIVSSTVDRNFDGRIDQWTYFENGIPVRGEGDDNFDGKPDAWWKYSNEQYAESSSDTDFNGIPDSFTSYDKGVPVATDWRPNGAKVTRMRSVLLHGVLQEELKDTDRDGQFDLRVRYDPFGEAVETNRLQQLLSVPAAKP